MISWNKRRFLVLAICMQSMLLNSQETRIVNYSADSIVRDERLFGGMKRMIGNVYMEHNDVILYCDSAHLDEKTNRFIGFEKVHIIKADTINIWSNKIDYNGQQKKARLNGNVRMDNGSVLLRSPVLDYDMNEEVAWYFGGGQIIDTTNIVESYWGYFYVDRNEFVFRDDVILSNDESTLITDTLRYLSKTEEMWFSGFSQIFGDTNYITCERGYSDSRNSFSSFQHEVFMESGQQRLRGDSLAYYRNSGDTEVFRNVEMHDTVDQMIVQGQHLAYNDISGWFRMTEEVSYIMADSEDSLYLHADTLVSVRDTVAESRHITAFPKVQFYRKDLQGRCLNLDYLVSDSLIRMRGEPIIWQEKTQLSADSIQIKLADKGVNYMRLEGAGFMIIEEDSAQYNQIKGKTIIGWFKNDTLSWVDVSGNGESLFYPPNDDEVIGLNKVSCSNIKILFKDGKLNDMRFYTQIDPVLTPLEQVGEAEKFLDGFQWHDALRPKNKDDIKIWK